MATSVDIAVFAHNEAGRIGRFLADLRQQTVLSAPDLDVRIQVLANGCRDGTVAEARAALAGEPRAGVQDLAEPGKSRTWQRFVHHGVRADAAVLVCCDADILLPQPGGIEALVRQVLVQPELCVASSLAVKDLSLTERPLSLVERLIVSSADTAAEVATAICGQLYAIRAATARQIPMLTGLPVEDGYLRAMVLTNCFTEPEQMQRVACDPEQFHIYASERELGALIRHQTRIVIGSAVNMAVFRWLTAMPVDRRRAALTAAAQDAGALRWILRAQLPDWRFGWVPVHFLLKRTQRRLTDRTTWRRPSAVVRLGLVFGFDALVYVVAQLRMARGAGAGFW